MKIGTEEGRGRLQISTQMKKMFKNEPMSSRFNFANFLENCDFREYFVTCSLSLPDGDRSYL